MKKEIRKEIILRRKRLDEKIWIERSREIQNKLLLADFYGKAKAVLIYCHFDREVRTDAVIEDAFMKGKVVCIPFNDMPKKTFLPSAINSLQEIDRTKRIPQPSVLKPFLCEKIDLVVLPGVAFDTRGNRIGMGGGFFDRFLKQIKSGIIRVALAFDFQVLEGKFSPEPWDEVVDVIITEKRSIVVKG